MADWSKCLSNGVPVSGGALPTRKDINTLSDAEMFLYVEGLRRLQAVDISDNLSYYRLAAIHGEPRERWPQFDKDIPQVNKNAGFCTHSSILFLTWHRPYLATFESALYKHVNDVVQDLKDPNEKTSPSQKTYKELAQSFRIPYWDWAYGASVGQLQHYPPAAKDNTYPVTSCPAWKDNDTDKKYPKDHNPLFAWSFPKGVPDSVQADGKSAGRTVRFPNDPDAAATWARMDRLTGGDGSKAFPQKNFSERIGYLLQSYARFGPVSSTLFKGGKSPQGHPEVYGSFEDVHNSIHNATGGGGHMSDPSISAFDPLFWLHHTNIDRCIAIWEAIHQDDTKGHEDTWVQETDETYGTWAIAAGKVDGDTPLYPFRRTTNKVGAGAGAAKADFFTSNGVKGTKQFGYTYPELAGLNLPFTSDTDRTNLGNRIGALYSTAVKSFRMSINKDTTAGEDMLMKSALVKQFTENDVPATTAEMISAIPNLPDQQTLLQASNESNKPVLRDLVPNNKYLEWLIDIKAEKHSLGGAYSVHFFLGDVQETNVYLWPLSPYHVGTFVPFGQGETTGCAKCQQEQSDHLQITGQIPLTIALMERYLAQIIPNMDEATVVDFLTKNLHWRVELNGQALDDRSQVAGLQVFVVTNEVTLPEDDSQLPTYADDVVIHPEITTNRNGGGRGEGTGLTSDGML